MSADEEAKLGRNKTAKNIATLVEHYLPEAIAFVRSACRNRFEPDEQMSIAAQVLMSSVPKFDPSKGRLMTFIKPAIKGAVKQAWRDREPVRYGPNTATAKQDPSLFDEVDEEAVLEGSVDPDWDGIDLRERLAALEPMLRRLPEHELRIIYLHYHGGISFANIARMLRVTRAAVWQMHNAVLRRIRNRLVDTKMFDKLTEADL